MSDPENFLEGGLEVTCLMFANMPRTRAEASTCSQPVPHGADQNVDFGGLIRDISDVVTGRAGRTHGYTDILSDTPSMRTDHPKGLRLIQDQAILVLQLELDLKLLSTTSNL